MKFEKIDKSTAPSSSLSSDDIAAANRYEERKARQEAEKTRPPTSPYTRTRIAKLFRELSDGIQFSPMQSNRPSNARPRDARDLRASREDALERLESLQDRYVDSPPLHLSEEALTKLEMK